MLDINRFISDGVGLKNDKYIKSMHIVTSETTVASLGIDPDYSVAVPLGLPFTLGGGVNNFTVGNLAAGGSTSGAYPQLVIEFYPKWIKTKQQGSYTGFTDQNIAINSVTTSNCIVFAYGYSNERTSTQYRYTNFIGSLTSPTNLLLDASVSGYSNIDSTVNWVVLEFESGVL